MPAVDGYARVAFDREMRSWLASLVLWPAVPLGVRMATIARHATDASPEPTAVPPEP